MAKTFQDKILSRFPNLDSKSSLHEQLTSIEIVDLLSFVEKEFDIEIASIEYSVDLLESFGSLEKFVRSKMKR